MLAFRCHFGFPGGLRDIMFGGISRIFRFLGWLLKAWQVTTKGVGILWKTYGENNRIYVVFCDFRVPLGFHFGDPEQHQQKNKDVFLVTFLGWGPGGLWDAFWMLFGCFVDAFW